MDIQDIARHSGPPATLRIRASADADIPAIAAIYAHHVRHGTASFETEAPDAAEIGRRRADILGKDYPHIVAEDAAGDVLGYAYVSAYRPRAAYRNTVENSIYIRHDAARRGIGRALLAELIRRAEALGLRQMVAVVGDSANLASIRLHEAMGFRLVGTLASVGRKHGRWLDSVLLQRALGEGDETPPRQIPADQSPGTKR